MLPRKPNKSPEGGSMSVKVSMKVNGKPVSADLEARTLLVTFIREQLRLTGTHVGCDTAQCGACTVLMNGKAIKSCSIVAMQAEGADILTIEGVARPDGTLHPMQAAFMENHGLDKEICSRSCVRNGLRSGGGEGGRPARRLADHRRQRPADEGAAVPAARAGQGAARRRACRGSDRRIARASEGCRRAHRGGLRSFAGSRRPGKGQRRAADSRSGAGQHLLRLGAG